MKKLVEEVEDEGLVLLMGKVITLFCMNYFYTGKLIGVSDSYVLLKDPFIVYETGSFTEPDWKDAQKLPNNIYVMTNSIESFGVIK